MLLQPGVAEPLADGEHYWENQLADEMAKIQIFDGDPTEDWMQFRASMMGAAYGIVSPYLPMPYALTRRRLFAEYKLDSKLGSPPADSPEDVE